MHGKYQLYKESQQNKEEQIFTIQFVKYTIHLLTH